DASLFSRAAAEAAPWLEAIAVRAASGEPAARSAAEAIASSIARRHAEGRSHALASMVRAARDAGFEIAALLCEGDGDGVRKTLPPKGRLPEVAIGEHAPIQACVPVALFGGGRACARWRVERWIAQNRCPVGGHLRPLDRVALHPRPGFVRRLLGAR